MKRFAGFTLLAKMTVFALITAFWLVLMPLGSHAQTTFYINETQGSNGYDGLSNVVVNDHGPLLNIVNAISVASSGDALSVAFGFYQETNWDLGTKSLTLNPASLVIVYDSNPVTTDTDGDGMPDAWEVANGLNPTNSADASQTSTNPFAHGLTNLQVYQNQSVLLADNYSTVGDGIPDWWKVLHGLSLTDATVAFSDPDKDGHTNLQEYRNDTDPMNASSYPTNAPDYVCWWPFDEGSGTNTAAIGANLPGTLIGSPLPIWTTGIYSNALAFDGMSNEVVVADDPLLSPTNALSVMAWVSTDTNMTSEVVAKWSTNAAAGSYLLSLTNGQVALELMLNGQYTSLVGLGFSLSGTNWHHIAGTYDGVEMRVYLDGATVGSQVASGTVDVVNEPLRLGLLAGELDDVRLYQTALATNGVAAVFNGDSDGDGIPDLWEIQHGMNPFNPDDASLASVNPFAHGLSNLQVYQNQSVLFANNYSTLGDGIPDWWKVTYGFSLTDTNVASADPDGDGLSNLQKYQNGLNPFTSYAIAVPPIVVANSSGNSAFVSYAGAGVSYAWSIDNGTIDSGSGTPNISWSAGDSGTATVSMQLTTSGGTINLSAQATISPCVLPTNITVSTSVIAGSTNNTASVPTGFFTLTSTAFSNGPPTGIVQSSGTDSNFYGDIQDKSDDRFFEMTPQGILTTLYQFDTSHVTNGYGIFLPLQGTGNDTNHFYGVTYWGGMINDLSGCVGLTPWYGYGSVFRLTQQGASMTVTTLYKFANSPDGAYPVAGLVRGAGADSNDFYGVTELGGSSASLGDCLNGYGTIFRINLAAGGTNTIMYRFSGGTDGAFPRAGLLLGTNGYLYGTTSEGSGNYGTVFRILTNGLSYSTLHQFTNSAGDGDTPFTSLVQGSGADSTNFYGTTFLGGTNAYGTVFRMNTDGSTFVTLYQFSNVDGSYPGAALVQSYDGNYYGTTIEGGAYGNGTVYRISPQGTLTTLYSFTGSADGGYPDHGSQVSGKGTTMGSFDGYLYGTTSTGGTTGNGTVYKISLATYIWSITGGTITSGQGTPNITWAAGSGGSATISVLVSNSPVCATIVSTNIPITGGAFNEWYGPFNSWTNVSAFGTIHGDGMTDDYATFTNALARIGTNGCSPVLYCPLKYAISKTLDLNSRIGVAIVGKDAAVSGFNWIGATGSGVADNTTMFHMDNSANCWFERLTFDGKYKSFTLINHSQSSCVMTAIFDNANIWTDCQFLNTATGGLGIACGVNGCGFSNEGFLRCVFTNLGVAVETYNYNAIDGWMVNCYLANCGVGLQMNPGSLQAYETTFVNNGTDVFLNTENNATSATGCTSWHSYNFFVAADGGGNNTPVLLKGNTIIDPTGQPIVIGRQQGPFVVLDNVTAYSAGVAMGFSEENTTAVLLGNTNCFSPAFSFGSGPITNSVDNMTVSRGSLFFTQPGLPMEATNLNRTIVDMPIGFTASILQTAINSASDGTVIHIPFTNSAGSSSHYSIDSTVTIPTNLDIRIVGDGLQTKLGWDGSSPLPMFSLAHPSHATFSHLLLYGNPTVQNSASLIQISGVGSTSARVYIRDSISTLSTNANLDLGDCPNTTIDWRGNNETRSAGVGLLMEGRGTVKFITTDAGQSGIDAVVTNGGTLYVETSYNEDSSVFNFYRDLLISGASTVMYLSGIQHEQSIPDGYDGFYPNGGTTNAFGITNFSGIFTMSLEGGISDWVRISGTETGNVWLEGDTTFNSPTSGGSGIPTTNTTTFTPTQTQNWDYTGGFSQYSDVGIANAAYTRAMFAPSRSTYSDLGPMLRRTNQTDVLIEDTTLENSQINLQVTP